MKAEELRYFVNGKEQRLPDDVGALLDIPTGAPGDSLDRLPGRLFWAFYAVGFATMGVGILSPLMGLSLHPGAFFVPYVVASVATGVGYHMVRG